jgi:metal-responsive CopG/Arc/MetJ family transcriptional regulator
MAPATKEKPEAKTQGQTHIGCNVPTDLYRQVKGILGTQGRTLREVVTQALRQVIEEERQHR